MYKGQPNETIEHLDIIKGHLALYIQEVAQPKIKILKYNFNSKENRVESS